MIIFDYSFTNTGGGAGSGLKHAVHSIQFFFKNIFNPIFSLGLHYRAMLSILLLVNKV